MDIDNRADDPFYGCVIHVLSSGLAVAKRLSSACDFGDFRRDRSLSRVVQLQCQIIDQFLSIVRRCSHGSHAGGMLAGSRLQKRRVNGVPDIHVQQSVHKALPVRIKDHIRISAAADLLE